MTLLGHDLLAIDRLRRYGRDFQRQEWFAIVDADGRGVGQLAGDPMSGLKFAFVGLRRLTVVDAAAGPLLHIDHARTRLSHSFRLRDPRGQLVGSIEQRPTIGLGLSVTLDADLMVQVRLGVKAWPGGKADITVGPATAAIVRYQWPGLPAMVDAERFVVSFAPGSPPLVRLGALSLAVALDQIRMHQADRLP